MDGGVEENSGGGWREEPMKMEGWRKTGFTFATALLLNVLYHLLSLDLCNFEFNI